VSGAPRGTGEAAGLPHAATGGAGSVTTKRGLRGGRGLSSSRPGSRRGADRGSGGGVVNLGAAAEEESSMSAQPRPRSGGDFVACAAAGT